jgi:hypothetical protein
MHNTVFLIVDAYFTPKVRKRGKRWNIEWSAKRSSEIAEREEV